MTSAQSLAYITEHLYRTRHTEITVTAKESYNILQNREIYNCGIMRTINKSAGALELSQSLSPLEKSFGAKHNNKRSKLHLCVCMYVCMYVYIYIYIYVCVCVCAGAHTNII